MLLDKMGNDVDTLYAALPERLYVLDENGIVTFRTVVGSPGFDVDAWHAAVARQAARFEPIRSTPPRASAPDSGGSR